MAMSFSSLASTTPVRSRLATASLSCCRSFSTTPTRHAADFTHVVIGGGAVGLAIARKLASREGTSTVLIERHGLVGSETSSRNSEVIHAGLYYGHGTLKTQLCIQGKKMMYDLCNEKKIPHRNTKKWLVAQDEAQMGELEKIHRFAEEVEVPTRFLSRREIEQGEPEVRAEAGVLESASTGIVDSHSFMSFLEGSFTDELDGELVLHTTVTGIEHSPQGTYIIHSTSGDGSVNDPIESETLINSAGLNAIPVSNLLLPSDRHRRPYYAKGTYFSYASSHPRPRTLIYPAPVPGLGGLGTHLTLDLSGRVRFGPDVEWVNDPTDLTPNRARLAEALVAIRSYLPGLDAEAVDLDYCGIRPKLAPSGGTGDGSKKKGFVDFYVQEEQGFPGFVNLLGIESPGLTSSLAIAEYVFDILYGNQTPQR